LIKYVLGVELINFLEVNVIKVHERFCNHLIENSLLISLSSSGWQRIIWRNKTYWL